MGFLILISSQQNFLHIPQDTNPPEPGGFNYDQLNRIRNAEVIGRNISPANAWINAGNTTSKLNETFKYDQNGNITKLVRNSNTGSMDDLYYFYYDMAGSVFNPINPGIVNPTNKLAYVFDAQGGPTIGDIGDQSANILNYTYDKTGNLISDASENISNISWSVYGKIKSVIRNVANKPDMYFEYDASGNRVSKKVVNAVAQTTVTTYYVRDAQGNVMSTYSRNDAYIGQQFGQPAYNKDLFLSEFHIYGSSRIGLLNDNTLMGQMGSIINIQIPNPGFVPTTKRRLGFKNYEMSNHLGNVIAVISDRKLPVDANMDNIIDNFVPDMLSASDYYAFGSPMPGRQFNSNNYRYGFNGKEKDDEIKGSGNSYDFGDRIQDPRTGRFLSLDPLQANYPALSPYNFVGNNPIMFVDPDGRKIKLANDEAKKLFGRAQQQVLGSSDIFKINQNGFVSINKKAYRQYAKNATDDQKAIAKGIRDVIKSDKTVVNYAFETTQDAKDNQIQKNAITLPATETLPAYTIPELDLGSKSASFNSFTPEQAKKADLEGLENFSIISIDEQKTQNVGVERNDENCSNECLDVETSYFHELLDHGLKGIKNQNPDPKMGDKSKEVDYQNKSIRSKNKTSGTNIKERTGSDH